MHVPIGVRGAYIRLLIHTEAELHDWPHHFLQVERVSVEGRRLINEETKATELSAALTPSRLQWSIWSTLHPHERSFGS
jgi:hypothetical protein